MSKKAVEANQTIDLLKEVEDARDNNAAQTLEQWNDSVFELADKLESPKSFGDARNFAIHLAGAALGLAAAIDARKP